MMRQHRLHTSASFIALSAALLAAGGAHAQTADQPSEVEEVVVTGIRASIEAALEIKRSNSGVVDAIAAEDIGKFPDTNLAESLQRITGVAIDRSNGEGSNVTVRGFGGGFNLVTLNGRTMPTANVATVGGDQSADFAGGTSRSFDFSNLASEGVSALEVYKTGRAAIPSGGIGATINVRTRRPLDAEPGFSGSIGAKALYDTGVDQSLEDADKVTPEVSGLVNWVADNERFGVSLFGSYQKRNFTTRSVTSNDWNIRRYRDFIDPANGFVRNNNTTVIRNAPGLDTLVAIPNDSRYHFAEGERERVNGQATIQFKPTDTITLTADAFYARNEAYERRNDSTNWFNRPFDQVTFDDNPVVATAVFLQENLTGTKDMGFEQQYRANDDELQSFALNGVWQMTDRFSLSLDGHISEATSKPGAPNGTSMTSVSIGAPIINQHSVDYSGEVPVQAFTINDTLPRGDANGRMDVGDLGSQVARTSSQFQNQKVKEFRADGTWELDDNGSRFDFGLNYRTSEMRQGNVNTQQDLGSWGISNPRDINQYANGLVSEYCMACKFQTFDVRQTGPGLVSFRADAIQLYNALSPVYARGVTASDGTVIGPRAVGVTGAQINTVEEDIIAAYGQVTWKGELAGHAASLVAGIRWEQTKVDSVSLIRTPSGITWTADNDFTVETINGFGEPLSGSGKYNNMLPAMDFQVELVENMLARFSFSRTIARPDYGNLFAALTPGAPNRPIANGAIPLGTAGNPDLDPLISDNFDLSWEWYYKPGSFISVGFFDKRVQNFVGTGTYNDTLFDLRDPSSGQPGTRSGFGRQILTNLGMDQTDVNLFTATVLYINNGGDLAAAQAELNSYRDANGQLRQSEADRILAANDIRADASDPLFNFQIAQPINNRTGEIYGFEIAGTHFFGETGIGVAGAYTHVEGDVSFDIGVDPSQDQFALLGLSDTANATLIYDKHGISARLAWNWRDSFLQATNRGGSRNPVFVAPFGQLDLNISYDVTDNLAISFEGINLNGESLRTYARDENELWFAQELDTRYLLGARYRF